MYYFQYPSYYILTPFNCLTPSTQLFHNLELAQTDIPKIDAQTPQSPFNTLQSTFSQATIANNQQFSPRPSPKDRKPKNTSIDEDYRPEGGAGKRKGKMKQIENRNIVPNVIRLIVSFIQKKGKSQKILGRLFEKMKGDEGWSPSRYYHYQSMLKNRLNNYVKEETLGQLVKVHPEMLDIYGEPEQLFYNQITRVLIGEFIRDEFVLFLLTSKRLNRTKIYHHLAALRNIRRNIKKILLGRNINNP